LQAQVDNACVLADRDPATLARSVALYVQLPGGTGRGTVHPEPLDMSPIPLAALPDVLAAVDATGVSHVQLVLDPITVDAIAAAADVVNS
jgi:hypothetical protein